MKHAILALRIELQQTLMHRTTWDDIREGFGIRATRVTELEEVRSYVKALRVLRREVRFEQAIQENTEALAKILGQSVPERGTT